MSECPSGPQLPPDGDILLFQVLDYYPTKRNRWLKSLFFQRQKRQEKWKCSLEVVRF